MKKIFMVFSLVCACCFVTNVANALGLCRLTSCVTGGDSEDSILSTTGKIGKAAVNEGQCYRCNWGDDRYECPEGAVLALKHQDYDTNGEIIGIYKCEDEGDANDKWVKYNPYATCTGSLPSSAKNTRSYFSIHGGSKTGSVKSEDGDSLILGAASDGCVMYVCKDGYEPNADKTDCISKAAKQEAEERQKREQQNQILNKKNKCENSGGSWTSGRCSCDAAKNLVLASNKGECECKNSNYVYKSDKKLCEETDISVLIRECESAKDYGAYWNTPTLKCECQNESHEFRGGRCVIKQAIENCNAVVGATWNKLRNECVCTNDNMEMNDSGTECVEKKSIIQEREQKVIAGKIISAGGVLDSIVAGFGKANVWKNAQGEFNTARLASDSIAAVVLGTAGGLITSSVMKKHQVEDGFEDLKCVIGGQPVAGWGDEFRVGIQ